MLGELGLCDVTAQIGHCDDSIFHSAGIVTKPFTLVMCGHCDNTKTLTFQGRVGTVVQSHFAHPEAHEEPRLVHQNTLKQEFLKNRCIVPNVWVFLLVLAQVEQPLLK